VNQREQLLKRQLTLVTEELSGAKALIHVIACRWWGRAILRWAVARIEKGG
jgi:hypothetical protein